MANPLHNSRPFGFVLISQNTGHAFKQVTVDYSELNCEKCNSDSAWRLVHKLPPLEGRGGALDFYFEEQLKKYRQCPHYDHKI
jgi:hypothetical protein